MTRDSYQGKRHEHRGGGMRRTFFLRRRSLNTKAYLRPGLTKRCEYDMKVCKRAPQVYGDFTRGLYSRTQNLKRGKETMRIYLLHKI